MIFIKFRSFLKQISDKMEDVVSRTVLSNNSATCVFKCSDGFIEVSMTQSGNEVHVCHYRNYHDSTNLEEAVLKCLPNWEQLYSEAYKEMEKEEDQRAHLVTDSRYW